jgi:hypothetical protein
MIPYGLFSQILFLLLSVALVFTYIKPTFSEIDATQDKIETYAQEVEKVSVVNDKLRTLVASYSNVSQGDRLKLLAYMPDEVDTIAVPRDLYTIATQAAVIVRKIEYDGPVKQSTDVSSTLLFDPAAAPVEAVPTSNEPEAHRFIVSFEGSYAQIKTVLSLMEENAYPLEVHDLEINKTEGGFLSVDMDIITYDRTLPAPVEAALQ